MLPRDEIVIDQKNTCEHIDISLKTLRNKNPP